MTVLGDVISFPMAFMGVFVGRLAPSVLSALQSRWAPREVQNREGRGRACKGVVG
jgi:hypothetical protein